MILCISCEGKSDVDTLTYAVFPYLPDTGYYQELIEKRWSELEPDIKLVRIAGVSAVILVKMIQLSTA